MANGRMMIKQNAAPPANNNVAEKRKGKKYLFSFGISPGAINFQNCINITGSERIRDAMKATFRCIQNASAGARNTREAAGFSVIWKKGLLSIILTSALSGKVRIPKSSSE